MKWSLVLHIITVIVISIGILSLIGAWIAGEDGTFLGFSQAHFFNDATVLVLIAIGFGIGTLFHQREEQNKNNGR